jgi:hypothetical protein
LELTFPIFAIHLGPTFFRDCELQDVLDLVTVVYRFLVGLRRTGLFEGNALTRWLAEVRRIFKEENVHYSVDDLGGVHFAFDEEFARGTAAAISSLQGSRYNNALTAFEDAMVALSKGPPDGKTAIRRTFDAAENLFKMMFQNSPRLTSQDAKKLVPLLQRAYSTDSVATGAASKLLSAFTDWIDAAHYYRHEAGRPEPIQPPLALTVQMISVGASFIRLLAELDEHQQ